MSIFGWLRRRRASIEFARPELVKPITWAALFFGACPICGHEWLEGEIIGAIVTAYERDRNGAWRRSPGTRVVDALCVDRHAREGDFTVTAAREEGAL